MDTKTREWLEHHESKLVVHNERLTKLEGWLMELTKRLPPPSSEPLVTVRADAVDNRIKAKDEAIASLQAEIARLRGCMYDLIRKYVAGFNVSVDISDVITARVRNGIEDYTNKFLLENTK